MARSSFHVRKTVRAPGVCEDAFNPKVTHRFNVVRMAARILSAALPSAALVLLAFGGSAFGQADLGHVELHGGYTHVTSDGGLDGFNAGAGLRFNRRVSIGLDYDSAWDRSVPSVFILSSQGAIVVRSYLANYLIGPRIFFPTKKLTFKNQQFIPFAEFQFGGSHLSSTLEQTGMPNRKSSSNAYSWLLGGGADYGFNRHWSGRVNADLLRTHFASTGQGRFRLVLGIVYSFAGGGH